MDIKAGDVVRLKSGGPIMTVAKIKFFGKKARCIRYEEYKRHSMGYHNTSPYYTNEIKVFVERDFYLDSLEALEKID